MGAGPPWRRHEDTEWDTMCTFTGLGKGQGQCRDVEKGQWERGNPVQQRQGAKRHRDSHPNHADKTQPAQRGRTGGPGRRRRLLGQQHLVPLGWLRCHCQPLWWLGADIPPLQSQWKEKHKVGASKSCGVTLCQGSCFQKQTFLESSLLFQVGSSVAEEPQSCRATQAGPASPAPCLFSHPQTDLEGRTRRSQASVRGRDLLKVTGEGMAPALEAPQQASLGLPSLNQSPRGLPQAHRKEGCGAAALRGPSPPPTACPRPLKEMLKMRQDNKSFPWHGGRPQHPPFQSHLRLAFRFTFASELNICTHGAQKEG